MTPACMGGFCNCRDRCAHHLTDDREEVSERLCQPGNERPEPVAVVDVLRWAKPVEAEQ